MLRYERDSIARRNSERIVVILWVDLVSISIWPRNSTFVRETEDRGPTHPAARKILLRVPPERVQRHVMKGMDGREVKSLLRRAIGNMRAENASNSDATFGNFVSRILDAGCDGSSF